MLILCSHWELRSHSTREDNSSNTPKSLLELEGNPVFFFIFVENMDTCRHYVTHIVTVLSERM